MSTSTNAARRTVRWALVLAIVATGLIGAATPLLAVQVPRTLLHERPVTAGPVEVAFGIDFIGVLWDGEGHGHDVAPQVRVRTDGTWGPWQTLVEDGADSGHGWASGLLSVGGASAYQVRGVPAHAVAARAAAINTTDGPLETVAYEAASAAAAATPCRSRADWGADESLRASNDAFDYHRPQVMTVHHTAGANGSVDPSATVRGIYAYHVQSRGYDDIAYNYLVDERGVIYEGRWSGSRSRSCLRDDGDGSDFAHHPEDERIVRGAHTANYNTANIGIAVLGTYTEDDTGQAPTSATVGALKTLLTELSIRHGFDPNATVEYVNRETGVRKTNPTISGHRDWGQTTCPGGRLYDLLPQIRRAVASRVDRTVMTVARLVQRVNTDGALVVVTTIRDGNGNAIQGAAVTIRVRRAADETMAGAVLYRESVGVTSAKGHVRFVYTDPRAGCYRVRVRDVALDGREWDGRSPPADPRTLCL
ncbi:MAG: N-acetylmuramoyl-L-alanine amidase [Actinobacteria bacterium]|nr:N-acetylmuramoyl-L-alanine amidase [Actinomycetota bacterium]